MFSISFAFHPKHLKQHKTDCNFVYFSFAPTFTRINILTNIFLFIHSVRVLEVINTHLSVHIFFKKLYLLYIYTDRCIHIELYINSHLGKEISLAVWFRSPHSSCRPQKSYDLNHWNFCSFLPVAFSSNTGSKYPAVTSLCLED